MRHTRCTNSINKKCVLILAIYLHSCLWNYTHSIYTHLYTHSDECKRKIHVCIRCIKITRHNAYNTECYTQGGFAVWVALSGKRGAGWPTPHSPFDASRVSRVVCRVLRVACRAVGATTSSPSHALARYWARCGTTFAGFWVLWLVVGGSSVVYSEAGFPESGEAFWRVYLLYRAWTSSTSRLANSGWTARRSGAWMCTGRPP